MKKLVFYLILHIGCALAVFNPSFVIAEEASSSVMVDTYEIKNLAPAVMDGENNQKPQPIITSNNEFAKLFFVFNLIDKLYPDEKINHDFTNLLGKIYPGTKQEHLELMQSWFQSLISLKRRYIYVVNALEQKVKALAMLPLDAPIVAEDGEYAEENPDQRKQTPHGEYGINYQPYKYLEYDQGESGEPVRRRDKNYVESVDISDEVALAILKFDIPAIYRALKKVPKYNDGSGEKTIKLPNGVQARLLLDLSNPGDAETIKGVIDMYIPNGYYVNGDFLNMSVRPRFFLSEDKDNNRNIKSYQLHHPAPGGVVQKGKNKRIYIQHVRFPIEFTRADVEKGIKIKGNFQFVLCDKSDVCQPMQTEHELSLKPSENHVFSIYNNYIMQAFAHLPQETSTHATLKEAQYFPQEGKLKVRFDVSRKFSNVAVMAEDGIGTNFTNPHYAISENEVIAEFNAPTNASLQEIAVTAIFNDYESLRKVVTAGTYYETAANKGFQRAGKAEAFIFGLFLNLMPGIMYLFIRLTGFLWQRKHRIRIFLRYALGSALGFILLALLYHKRYFSEIYANNWLIIAAGMVAVSFLMEGLGYMDFALFRPLSGKAKRGLLCGFFSTLLITAFPMYLAPEVLSHAFTAPFNKAAELWLSAWGGLLFLPLLMLLFRSQGSYFLLAMLRFNVFYTGLFLAGMLLLIYLTRGFSAFLISLVFLALTAGIWYIYPILIQDVTKHTRSLKRKAEIFQKVQKSALSAIFVIYLLAAGLLTLFKQPQPLPAPTPEQVYAIAATENNAENPVLVAITADWSVTSLLNIKDIKLLADAGFKIIHIKTGLNAANALPWFATYGKDFAPLNILFTNRHPHGLVIPEKLQELNWLTALTELEKRKSPHD